MDDALTRLQKKDAELARLTRCAGRLKLRMGDLLNAVFEINGHHELGFSSIEGYVGERCGRSRTWGRETRAMARRLREKELAEIRKAILTGRLSWSMAELLAAHATRETEVSLLEKAAQSTVRAMRSLLTGKTDDGSGDADESPAIKLRPKHLAAESELAMLAASRVLVEYLNGARPNDDDFVTALLGEGETSLQLLIERSGKSYASDRERHPFPAASLAAIAASIQAAKAEAKRRSPLREAPHAPAPLIEALEDRPLPKTLRALDAELVRCSRELAQRDLAIARLTRELKFRGAWRPLGYESLGQYATERAGLSLSSFEHRSTLARRVAQYPQIGQALDEGVIGYEAALLVGRVVGVRASDALVAAWIERASRRTVRHLRDEIALIELALGYDQKTSRFPPSAEDLLAFAELQRKIQSGELVLSYVQAGARGPQTSVTADTTDEKRAVRFTLSADVCAHWGSVQAEYRSFFGRDTSFIAFLCTSLWESWLPFLQSWNDKWKEIYHRDGHRCSNPVCERRDVTLHHMKYRAHGGTDDPENLLSLCAWCHLQGIHRGRLTAEGTASKPTWTIGRDPIMVVEGREKRIAV